jgi:hypothetical protein
MLNNISGLIYPTSSACSTGIKLKPNNQANHRLLDGRPYSSQSKCKDKMMRVVIPIQIAVFR